MNRRPLGARRRPHPQERLAHTVAAFIAEGRRRGLANDTLLIEIDNTWPDLRARTLIAAHFLDQGRPAMTPLGEAALRLGAKGLRVFPLAWREKFPVKGSDGYKSAQCDETLIRAMWGEQGQWNIGVATGRASGVWVTDEDGAEDARDHRDQKHLSDAAQILPVSVVGRHHALARSSFSTSSQGYGQ
jgi:hypothetical protein